MELLGILLKDLDRVHFTVSIELGLTNNHAFHVIMSVTKLSY
jgi:hypothetical protein